MTWVIGVQTLFELGALVSDTRVTFRDGRTVDLIKKGFPMARNVAAGFAGSVAIGFEMLDALATILRPANQARAFVDPPQVSQAWAERMRIVFDRARGQEKQLGAQAILVGVSPTEGTPGLRRVYVFRYSAPELLPRRIRNGFDVTSIGSGSAARPYKQALRQLLTGRDSGLYRLIPFGLESWAMGLSMGMNFTAARHPVSSVSTELYTLAFTLDRMVDGIARPEGAPALPRVATDYGEFVRLARGLGAEAGGAVC